MKRLLQHWEALNQSIYQSKDRRSKNLSALYLMGLVCTIFGSVMTILNIIQHKGFVTYTTLIFAIGSIAIAVSAKYFQNRTIPIILTLAAALIIFTYYTIGGVNDGFAILWTLLVPLGVCYFLSVKYGILLSLYFELLVIVLFYTPLRRHFEGIYDPTFMNRFPILYLCGLILTTICMTQYHENVLIQMEYTKGLNEEVQRQTKIAVERATRLNHMNQEMVEALAQAIDAKDKYTNGHSLRVSKYSVALATHLNWPEKEILDLEQEALLHDIGKIGVPDSVLNKPGRLTDEEYLIIQSHASMGGDILSHSENLRAAAEVANHHHERYDGRGYPDHLKGEQIPKHARVVAIADAYDAMSSDRIYRAGLSPEFIRKELERGRGLQFDPVFLDAFLELMNSGELEKIKSASQKPA